MDACNNLKEKCVTELLRLGANVNAIDKYGETALYKIASHMI
jgi:ankyrin repeat protein